MDASLPSSGTLHEEHVRFEEGTEQIRRLADAVGQIDLDELRPAICRSYEELLRRLVPHAMAEDRSPLSQVGVPEPTPTPFTDAVTREHLEIAQLLEELDALRWELAYPTITGAQEQALRRVLYGLYALLRVHLVGEAGCICEERIALP